MMSRQ